MCEKEQCQYCLYLVQTFGVVHIYSAAASLPSYRKRKTQKAQCLANIEYIQHSEKHISLSCLLTKDLRVLRIGHYGFLFIMKKIGDKDK